MRGDVDGLPALVGTTVKLGAMVQEPPCQAMVPICTRVVQCLPAIIVGISDTHASLQEQLRHVHTA